jgi:hypothetical protein
MKHICPCGQPAHPCYMFRCEDCWVDANVIRAPVDRRPNRPARPPSNYNPFIRMFNAKPEDV